MLGLLLFLKQHKSDIGHNEIVAICDYTMESGSEALGNNGAVVPRRQKDDMNLKVLLFSPIKDVASWLNLPDKQMPFLEQVSPRSGVAGDMTPSTSVISEVSVDETIVSATPRDIASPKDNDFDPFRDILNLFSPPRKPAATSNKTQEFPNVSALKSRSGSTPCNSDPPKRLDFEAVDAKALPVGSTVTPVQREVATIQDLCNDTRKGLEQVVARVKQVNLKEWLEKARQVDTHELAESAKTATKATVKKLETHAIKIVDSAKEIDPKLVLTQAKTSTKELTDAVRINAQVHPLPWAVIGIVFLAILMHVIFVGGSVGTPAMGFWRFTTNFYGSRPVTGSTIVDRVASFLQTEMGEDAKQIIEGAKSTGSCDAMSGNDILAKLSASLHQPMASEPDLVDVVVEQIDMIREHPREYMRYLVSSSQGFISNVLRQGRQLTTDAFYEVTAL